MKATVFFFKVSFTPFLFQIYQSWLDKSTPFYAVRWAATLLLTAVYMIRVYVLQVNNLIPLMFFHFTIMFFVQGSHKIAAVIEAFSLHFFFKCQNVSNLEIVNDVVILYLPGTVEAK